jgi:hypothetical protein
MMARQIPKIDVFEVPGGYNDYFIAFVDEDWGDPGFVFGDDPGDDLECVHFTNAIQSYVDEHSVELHRTDMRPKTFGYKKDATAAMKRAREALRHIEKPWPEWAVKAKAEGWKPPKNWKP